MSNIIGGKKQKEIDMAGITVHTRQLFELNIKAQDAVREFALHDVDEKEEIEKKRIAMHDAFTELYQGIATFGEKIMGDEFDISYLRDRLNSAEDETKQQLEQALEQLIVHMQKSLADVWMAKTMSWLHQAAAVSGPFVEGEHTDKIKSAANHLAGVYTMLEKPFAAIPLKIDGTQKLRRVALGYKAHSLISENKETEKSELAEILGKNKLAEAEFYDEFLNELIGLESSFRQAFNPFDELIWRDILSSFIFEQATSLYNEAIPHMKKSKAYDKARMELLTSWKRNTSGLSEVYLAMTYNDIADAQMRAGNLEDASKLYMSSSEAFGRAEKAFRKVTALEGNADQSKNDMEHKKAQAMFCHAEATVQTFSELLSIDNKEEALITLKEIFDDMKKAEELSKTRELTGAIKENLRIFSFLEELLTKKDVDLSSIQGQIEFAKDLRKTGLVEDVNKALDEASKQLGKSPVDALEAIREALTSLGILLSLETADEEVTKLRNRTLAILNNVKYFIQFQVSGQLPPGVKFILSRILENLHAAEAATYYKVIGEDEPAAELTDLGRLALATGFASEAQLFARQAEQWAFRSQIERTSTFQRLESEVLKYDDEDVIQKVIKAHDAAISRIKQAIASFASAGSELGTVEGEEIRKRNNIEAQVTQLQGVVMKYKGDLSRLEGAKSDFMAEFHSKKGERSIAQKHYSDASDLLREAVGNYTVAAKVFQSVGDSQAAQTVDSRAKVADLLARGVWDNRARLQRDQDPSYKADQELIALYQGGTQ